MSRTDMSPPTCPRPAWPIIVRSVVRDWLALRRSISRRRSGAASVSSARSRRQAAAARGSATSMEVLSGSDPVGGPAAARPPRGSGTGDGEVADRLGVVGVHQHAVDRLLLRLAGLAAG